MAIYDYILLYMGIYGYMKLYMAICTPQKVFGVFGHVFLMSRLVFCVSGFVFGCLDLCLGG